jgi:hypothetical protein
MTPTILQSLLQLATDTNISTLVLDLVMLANSSAAWAVEELQGISK